MNKEYEVVWNPSSEEWIVASELTEKKDLKSGKSLCLQKSPFKNHLFAVINQFPGIAYQPAAIGAKRQNTRLFRTTKHFPQQLVLNVQKLPTLLGAVKYREGVTG